MYKMEEIRGGWNPFSQHFSSKPNMKILANIPTYSSLKMWKLKVWVPQNCTDLKVLEETVARVYTNVVNSIDKICYKDKATITLDRAQ